MTEHVLEVAGRDVTVTSPDKVFFSERGETKLDLVRYYLAVGEPLMRADRAAGPTLLQRFPNGAEGTSFFQKRVPDERARWLQTTIVSDAERHDVARARAGRPRPRGVGGEPRLPRLPRVAVPGRPTPSIADELRIDLDPPPGVAFDEVREAAREVRRLLDELGIAGYPKTTGNRGLHVYVRLEPRWDSYEVRAAAVAVARELERRRPDLITAAWWKEERGRRVFVDFNQNAPHKTVFGAWSVRARPGAQVSTPFALGRARRDPPRRADDRHRARAARGARRPVGGDGRRSRSRSSRCSSCTSATWPPACPTRPGRPSTRRCPTSRPASPPAGRGSASLRGEIAPPPASTSSRSRRRPRPLGRGLLGAPSSGGCA